jgi:hypothetical protein
LVLLIRALHGGITLFFVGCIGYIYYAGLTGKVGWPAYLAVTAVLAEGVAFSLGRGNCPLGALHRRYGDEKAFFELLLPRRAAKLAVPILGVIAAAGILLLLL